MEYNLHLYNVSNIYNIPHNPSGLLTTSSYETILTDYNFLYSGGTHRGFLCRDDGYSEPPSAVLKGMGRLIMLITDTLRVTSDEKVYLCIYQIIGEADVEEEEEKCQHQKRVRHTNENA